MSKGNRARRKALGLLPEPGKCAARTRAGVPCKRAPIKGAAVCRAHGGAAPQVQRKAQERIAHASDIAVLQILALMQAPDTPAPVKLAAARDLLDRANVTGKTTIEVDLPWKELLSGIVATVEPGAPLREFAEAQPPVDPLVIEAERVNAEAELARYTPDDSDYEHPEAYGDDLPSGLPVSSRAGSGLAEAPPVVNGDDRPPPPHPLPERRRIEPDDPDYWAVPRTYKPTAPPPRKGRVAGRRR